MKYRITKINAKTEEERDYGVYSESEVKDIVKGYKFNGLFYEREGSNWFYMVEEA
jgi:hypothetical protein